MIQAAIFDFDGTLADTLPLCREAFRRAVQDLSGKTLTNEEIESQFGPDDLGVIQRLIPEKPQLHEEGRKLFLHYYRKLHQELAPAPFCGAAKLLKSLQNKGIQLAMVTGKRLESAEISLQFFHLAEFFPILETGSPMGGVKPERIKQALAKLNVSAENAIYIGDAPSDVDACRTVPIRILAAAWAPESDITALQKKNPDYLLTRFEELDLFFQEHHGNKGL